MLYLFLKTIHIVAVVLFLGNITTGVFWKLFADRSGDARFMAATLDGILSADRVFTAAGATLILLSGTALAWLGGYPLFTFWIWAGLALFVASAVIFKRWAEPAQRQMLAVARAAEFDREAYARVSRSWMWSGTLATLAPYAALALMVFKPA